MESTFLFEDDAHRQDPLERKREPASEGGEPQGGLVRPDALRTVSAMDLRRRTSEIIAALERNEELMISYRDQWVGIITPINLVEGYGYHRPLRRHRYFGYGRRAPKLRRKQGRKAEGALQDQDAQDVQGVQVAQKAQDDQDVQVAQDAPGMQGAQDAFQLFASRGLEEGLFGRADPPPGQVRPNRGGQQ